MHEQVLIYMDACICCALVCICMCTYVMVCLHCTYIVCDSACCNNSQHRHYISSIQERKFIKYKIYIYVYTVFIFIYMYVHTCWFLFAATTVNNDTIYFCFLLFFRFYIYLYHYLLLKFVTKYREILFIIRTLVLFQRLIENTYLLITAGDEH